MKNEHHIAKQVRRVGGLYRTCIYVCGLLLPLVSLAVREDTGRV